MSLERDHTIDQGLGSSQGIRAGSPFHLSCASQATYEKEPDSAKATPDLVSQSA